MVELSISGRSEGLAASAAVDAFAIRPDSMTGLLSSSLDSAELPELPFGVLGIWVEALNHTDEGPIPGPISVKSVKKLGKHHSGKLQKMYELTMGRQFYELPAQRKAEAIADAFTEIARLALGEFPGPGGSCLSEAIAACVATYLAGTGTGPNNSSKPTPLRGAA